MSSRLNAFRQSRNAPTPSPASPQEDREFDFSSLESFYPGNQQAQRGYGLTLEDDGSSWSSSALPSSRIDSALTPRSAKRLRTYSQDVCGRLGLDRNSLDEFTKVCLIHS